MGLRLAAQGRCGTLTSCGFGAKAIGVHFEIAVKTQRRRQVFFDPDTGQHKPQGFKRAIRMRKTIERARSEPSLAFAAARAIVAQGIRRSEGLAPDGPGKVDKY